VCRLGARLIPSIHHFIMEHIMKPEQTIQFLAELLELAEELNRIVKQYCRLVTTDQSGHGHYAEKKDSEYDALF
jgi:hypothetical protein